MNDESLVQGIRTNAAEGENKNNDSFNTSCTSCTSQSQHTPETWLLHPLSGTGRFKVLSVDKPLVVELFCGSFGWSAGFLAEGYRAIGFDIEHLPHHGPVPEGAELVLQDVLTLHGSQFRDATVIVASPPCQNYSYLAMPWSRSTDWVRPDGDGYEVLNSAAAKAMREEWMRNGPDNRLFDACFRIQAEAIEARQQYRSCECLTQGWPNACSKCYIPLVVENVRGAIPWVGRSAWNFGSFHLWGDVPALMPKQNARKVPVYSDPRRNGGKGVHITSPAENEEGTKIGGDWFRDPACHSAHGSRSSARKQASAQIAKIPFALANHIARVYKPREILAGTSAQISIPSESVSGIQFGVM